jgi:hypothetical protein
MKMKNLTVVAVEVGKEPEIKTVEHTLEEMHKLVEGYIETVRVAEDILLIVNEEGMITDLPVNFHTLVIDRGVVKPVHQIHGNVFFVSVSGEDFASLDKEQIQKVLKMFKHKREFCVVAQR